MTEKRLQERLAQILTKEELLNVDAYFSRRDGLCIDVYTDDFSGAKKARLLKNLKVVSMGKAKIRTLTAALHDDRCDYGAYGWSGFVA